ncbi:unnamed protein product [Cyclocybe aegerita]|uniref:DUF6533 domain-containing protein n=1 Tax=Cyclocybe aegerita TaxID=1973307 RepID=A0A8S0WBC1_CYCAE|nr:unnamed protein product [Cyclocybe aegerita]
MDPAILVENLKVSTVIKRVDLAASIIFLWDYFLTLGLEVDHIWSSRWTIVKVLFLFQRYIPFIDIMVLGMYMSFGENVSETRCTRVNYAWKFLSIAGVVASEAILCFRVWAVWNRRTFMSFLLPALFAGSWVPAITLLAIFMKSIKYIYLRPPFLGCVVASADKSISFEFFLIWDTVMLSLMAIAALKAYHRSGRTALFKIVYGEGIIYYFYLFAASTVNIILNHNNSIAIPYRFLAVAMLRSLHTILPSRALLHLRSLNNEVGGHNGEVDNHEFEPIEFALPNAEKRSRITFQA